MRRKIKALIIRYGILAIWATLNPNDITNPVKLRLAAYRKEDNAAAEATLLRALQDRYERVKLAITDPIKYFYTP
jgi:hypothetical protein